MYVQVIKRLFGNKRGAAMVEYGLLIAGVALISAAAVSVFGHKTSDIIGTVAAILPGAHTDDNGPIISGKLIETTSGGAVSNGVTGISLDVGTIATEAGKAELGINIGAGTVNGVDGLIVEAH